jgi:hypothetical protein
MRRQLFSENSKIFKHNQTGKNEEKGSGEIKAQWPAGNYRRALG